MIRRVRNSAIPDIGTKRYVVLIDIERRRSWRQVDFSGVNSDTSWRVPSLNESLHVVVEIDLHTVIANVNAACGRVDVIIIKILDRNGTIRKSSFKGYRTESVSVDAATVDFPGAGFRAARVDKGDAATLELIVVTNVCRSHRGNSDVRRDRLAGQVGTAARHRRRMRFRRGRNAAETTISSSTKPAITATMRPISSVERVAPLADDDPPAGMSLDSVRRTSDC